MTELAGLKVCFVAGTLGQGGAEQQLYYILQTLKGRGACPSVLCLTRGEFWEPKIRALGVPVVWVGRSPLRPVRLAHIVRAVRVLRPRVVQSQHAYTNLYASIAARLGNARAIGASRNDPAWEFALGGALGRLNLHMPHIIAANSRYAVEEAMGLGVPAGRVSLLPNVVDTARFRPAPRRGHAGPASLLAVARCVPQKRLDRFIALVARLQASLGLPVRGLIAGDGPLRPRLEQQAAELGLLTSGIEFLGTVPDTAEFYRRADVLVLTSLHEGTPNAVMEAMASGLPVVATRVGGVPDLVADGETGLLADADDLNGLVDAAAALLRDPAARAEMGLRARQRIVERHSLSALPSHLERLYQAVLS